MKIICVKCSRTSINGYWPHLIWRNLAWLANFLILFHDDWKLSTLENQSSTLQFFLHSIFWINQATGKRVIATNLKPLAKDFIHYRIFSLNIYHLQHFHFETAINLTGRVILDILYILGICNHFYNFNQVLENILNHPSILVDFFLSPYLCTWNWVIWKFEVFWVKKF